MKQQPESIGMLECTKCGRRITLKWFFDSRCKWQNIRYPKCGKCISKEKKG